MSKEIIGIPIICRDYGLSRPTATRYVKASGKMLERNGTMGAPIKIMRKDFEAYLAKLKGRTRNERHRKKSY